MPDQQHTDGPSVSIIVPTYNRAHLLPRCLDSLLDQSDPDLEIIVVDDGSTDDTAQVLQRYSSRDSRVRTVSQDNEGGCAARNAGVDAATSPWITFLDSDDEVTRDWLTELVTPLKQGADVVCCGYRQLAMDGSRVNETVPRPWSPEAPTSRVSGGLFLSGTFALKRDLFYQVGGYTTGLPANQLSEFRLRLLATLTEQEGHIATTDAILAIGHQHAGPNIRSDTRAIYESAVFIIDKHLQQLRQCPRTLASWSTAAGGCAARLGLFAEARHRFGQAIRYYPRDARNYARWLVAFVPGLRLFAWRNNNQ